MDEHTYTKQPHLYTHFDFISLIGECSLVRSSSKATAIQYFFRDRSTFSQSRNGCVVKHNQHISHNARKKEHVILLVERCDVVCTLHVLLTSDLLTAKSATAPIARQHLCGSKSIQVPHQLTEHKTHSPNSIIANSLTTQNTYSNLTAVCTAGFIHKRLFEPEKIYFHRC